MQSQYCIPVISSLEALPPHWSAIFLTKFPEKFSNSRIRHDLHSTHIKQQTSAHFSILPFMSCYDSGVSSFFDSSFYELLWFRGQLLWKFITTALAFHVLVVFCFSCVWHIADLRDCNQDWVFKCRFWVPCKRQSSVNSGAWLRWFDDVFVVEKSCIAKGMNRKKAKEKYFLIGN